MFIMDDPDQRVPLKHGTRLKFSDGTCYIIEEIIGAGGGGIVYRASSNEHIYAIKEIYPCGISSGRNEDGSIKFLEDSDKDNYGRLCEDARNRERYFSELIAGQGDNPHVIQSDFHCGAYINDSEILVNIAYLVMDRLVGCTLTEFIKECKREKQYGFPYRIGTLPDVRTSAIVIRSILYALKKIHNVPHIGEKCGTGHMINDIKTDNIYMYGMDFANSNSDWYPFIIDYGSVQKLDKNQNNMVTADVKHNAYTEGYASWEMKHQSVLYLTPASDLYSVGRIFLYMITGKTFCTPMHIDILTQVGDCNDETNIRVALRNVESKRAEINCGNYAFEKVKKIVERSITNNARTRYQTADEFIKDIDELIDRLGVTFYIESDALTEVYEDDDERLEKDYKVVDSIFENKNIVFATGWNRQIREKFAINYITHYRKKHNGAKILYKNSRNYKEPLYEEMLNGIFFYDAYNTNKYDDINAYLKSEEIRNHTLKEAVDKYRLVVIDELRDCDEKYIDDIVKLASSQTHILVIEEKQNIRKKYPDFLIGKNVTDKLLESYKKSYTAISSEYILAYEENKSIAYNNSYKKYVQNYNIKVNGKKAYSLDFDYPQAGYGARLKIKRYLSPAVHAILLLNEEKSAADWDLKDDSEKYMAIQYAIWSCGKASKMKDSRNTRSVFDMRNVYPVSTMELEKFMSNSIDLMSANNIINYCIDEPTKLYRVIEAAKKMLNAAEERECNSDFRFNVKTDSNKVKIEKYIDNIYYVGPFIIEVEGIENSRISAEPTSSVEKCLESDIVDMDGTEVFSINGEKEVYVKMKIYLQNDKMKCDDSYKIDIIQMCFKVDGVIKEGLALGTGDRESTEYAMLLERSVGVTYDVTMPTEGLNKDNTVETGNIRIISVNQYKERISGTVFEIKDLHSNIKWNKEADSYGLVELYNIKAGEYAVTQIKGRDGHTYEDEPHTLQVVSNMTSTITYVNAK